MKKNEKKMLTKDFFHVMFRQNKVVRRNKAMSKIIESPKFTAEKRHYQARGFKRLLGTGYTGYENRANAYMNADADRRQASHETVLQKDNSRNA